MTVKTDLKHRNIKALFRFFGRWSAMTPIRGNFAPERSNWPALKGKKLSPRQQEVLARIETKVGGEG